ncbi:MAG: VRR-NUC domain-containing protein [Pseudodesulfovibrio sp.]|uniref:VRR-NUC domain-containing protein n=1 Tax=Pseudodesulfovibrio sp. TaxID=2035812 RepID=UPI003D13FBBE
MSEHEIQKAVFQWADIQGRVARFRGLRLMYAVPNAGKRSKAVAGMMLAEGLKKGVPDVVLPVARGGYHGAYLEFKTAKGRVRPEQKEWLASLAEEGYFAAVVRSFDEATTMLADYMQGYLVRDEAA